MPKYGVGGHALHGLTRYACARSSKRAPVVTKMAMVVALFMGQRSPRPSVGFLRVSQISRRMLEKE